MLEDDLTKALARAAREVMFNEAKLDKVGSEDDDVDNDGDTDEADEYLKNRRKKISSKMKKESAEIEEEALLERSISQGANMALEAINRLTRQLKKGSMLNKGVNREAEGNYDSDFAKMHKHILEIDSIMSDIIMDIENS